MKDMMKDAMTLYFHLTENAIQPNAGDSAVESYGDTDYVVLRSGRILAVYVDTSKDDIEANPITGTNIEVCPEEDWPEALKEEAKE